MSFSALGLSAPLVLRIDEIGYVTPTPIQCEVIPAILAGQDLLATAQTGTGKSAAFLLPVLQRLIGGAKLKSNHIRALVLTPTRELAVQVGASATSYGRYLALKSRVVYGGVKINPQMMQLRGGADLLVATPGRLLDLCQQNAIKLAQLEILVLDEADRMLALGFSDELQRILALLPKRRQALLFSATMPAEMRQLAANLLRNPRSIEVSPNDMAAENVVQRVYEVGHGQKTALLQQLLRTHDWSQVLVFTRTKEVADRLARTLTRAGVAAQALHGDQRQGARSRGLANFKAGAFRVLVATDLAARGLDIAKLPMVINFELPHVAQDYLHRIGRSGRAGVPGAALALVCSEEVASLAAIEALLGQPLPREIASGFIPRRTLPQTAPGPERPKRPKKPRRPPLELAEKPGKNPHKES